MLITMATEESLSKIILIRLSLQIPGTLRVSLGYALAGGYSSPRNGTLIKNV